MQDGKKYAVIEVIDESECRNKWRINPAGKARALAGLLSRPLLGPPELGHEANQTVGEPVDFTSNHATRVLYEIPDPQVWEKIHAGEWGPVSPQLTPLAAHYEGDTFVVDDWSWDHVAFVPVGAFLNAGVKSTCVGDPSLCRLRGNVPCGFSRALTAALDSQSRLEATRWPRTETDVGAYSPERVSKGPEKKLEITPGGVIVKNAVTEVAQNVAAAPAVVSEQDLSIMEKAVESARGILESLEERLEILIYGKPQPEGPTPTPLSLSGADAWNTADAPDELFAVVPAEAKGPNGKKSLRKLPLASKQKRDLDAAIVRDTLSRLPQTDFAGTGVTKDEAVAKICSAAKKLNIASPLCGNVKGDFPKEEQSMECEHEKVIAELKDKNTKLEAELKEQKTKATELTETHKKLDAELKELKAKPSVPPTDAMVAVQAELKTVKAEYEALKAWRASQEEADHTRRVIDVVNLRVSAGLLDAKDVQAATNSLKKLSDDALALMKADLEAVKGKFDSLPSGPKARLIPTASGRFDPMQPTIGDLVGKKPGEK